MSLLLNYIRGSWWMERMSGTWMVDKVLLAAIVIVLSITRLNFVWVLLLFSCFSFVCITKWRSTSWFTLTSLIYISVSNVTFYWHRFRWNITMTGITNIATYLLDSRFIAGIIEKNITLTLNDKCVNNRVQIAFAARLTTAHDLLRQLVRPRVYYICGKKW